MFDYHYIHQGFVFIPCPSTTPGALRAQYLIPNLMPKCECLSIRPFLLFGPRHHAIPQIQRKQSFCRTEANCRPQVSLPNLLKKPFPAERDLLPSQAHKSASFLLPIFGVNIGPFNYGIKVILFRNWLQTPTSSNQICATPILSPCNPSESPFRSKP
jgi:hypothetical protein